MFLKGTDDRILLFKGGRLKTLNIDEVWLFTYFEKTSKLLNLRALLLFLSQKAYMHIISPNVTQLWPFTRLDSRPGHAALAGTYLTL